MPYEFNPFTDNLDVVKDVAKEIGKITGEPTGFTDRTATLSFNNANYTFTITGAHTIYIAGAKYVKTTDSIAITDATGLYYIYYNTSAVLTASTVWPGFAVPHVATVYWNTDVGSPGSGLLADERHGIIMDSATHEYLHDTVGTRYESGLAGTFTNTTFSITEGMIADEDIEYTVGEATTCDLLYKDGAATYKWLTNQTKYYYEDGGSDINYNDGNTLTPVGANNYVAYWIFATLSPVRPIIALMGQRTDVTLADARANNKYESLTLGTLPFKEMKLLYRVILRNDATPYIETQDYRSVSNLPSGTYVATDHGVLTGLTDDDHTQYALVSGTRTITVSTSEPTSPATGDLWVDTS